MNQTLAGATPVTRPNQANVSPVKEIFITKNMIKTLHFKDNIYEFTFIDHVRDISRGIVFNDKKEVAILKLKINDDFGLRDCYELPGGGVDSGETFIEAYSREMMEEVGYTVKDVKPLIDVFDFYNLIHRENHNHYFVSKVDTFVGQHLTKYEKDLINNVVWVSLDTAIELFTNNMFGGVGKLVQQRELPVLLELKERMMHDEHFID